MSFPTICSLIIMAKMLCAMSSTYRRNRIDIVLASQISCLPFEEEIPVKAISFSMEHSALVSEFPFVKYHNLASSKGAR